jgi:hypothetical protein
MRPRPSSRTGSSPVCGSAADFWDAILEHGHLDDLPQIARAAKDRGRTWNAMLLYTKAARAERPSALVGLAWIREEAEDTTRLNSWRLKPPRPEIRGPCCPWPS